jgi:transposase
VFRPWKIDEVWLLPPSVADFVPAGHPAHLIRDLVSEELDLSAIMGTYTEVKGYPPYHPAMMVALLLYAYRSGVYSSRRIARGCEERLDFQAVTALNQPDFRTICEFRRRHLDALAGLFVQVLALCRKAGLAGLDHVAVDGTKIKANASKHKAMSYARMVEAEAELSREVAEWLARAAAEDAAEDAAHGSTRRGDEPPGWMRDKQARLARIRAAKAELEAEARAVEAARPPPPSNPDGSPKPRPGRAPKHEPGKPKPKAQRNFTDPQSRIIKAATASSRRIMRRLRSMLTRRSSWRTGSPTMVLIRTRYWRCSMRSRPIRAKCQTKSPPITASAQRPISRASTHAPFAAMWLRGAPASQVAADRAASWFKPCAPGSAKADIKADTECENTPSNPCSDTSSKLEISDNSSCAASTR